MEAQINELLEILYDDLDNVEHMDADPMTKAIIRDDIQWEILRLESQLDIINKRKRKMETIIVLSASLLVVFGALLLAIYLVKKIDV
jgi:hypothetical protein